MAERFDGKVAVITGAASGIGRATARRFRAEGARLVLADIDEGGGAAVAAELGGRAAHVVFRRVDVTDAGAVDALMEDAVQTHGRLDVLFNNAGIGLYGKTPDLDPELWHHVIDVDLNSVFSDAGPPSRISGRTAAAPSSTRRRSRVCSATTACRPTRPPRARSPTTRARTPSTTRVRA